MSGETVRDLVLVTEAHRTLFGQVLRELWQPWVVQWAASPALGDDAMAIEVREAEAGDFDLPWEPLPGGGAGVWTHAPDRQDALWRNILLGSPRSAAHDVAAGASWADPAVDAARQDLLLRLSARLAVTGGDAAAGSPNDLRRPHAGALTVRIAPLGLSLLVDAAVWRPGRPPVAAASQAIAPLTDVLAGRSVRLALMLGETQVTVEDLAVLREGDVIRFPALLKDPLPLSVAGQASVLHAHVGAQDGRWAVTLVAQDGDGKAPPAAAKDSAPAPASAPTPPAASRREGMPSMSPPKLSPSTSPSSPSSSGTPAPAARTFSLPSSIKLN